MQSNVAVVEDWTVRTGLLEIGWWADIDLTVTAATQCRIVDTYHSKEDDIRLLGIEQYQSHGSLMVEGLTGAEGVTSKTVVCMTWSEAVLTRARKTRKLLVLLLEWDDACMLKSIAKSRRPCAVATGSRW
jgi:hypothetical protein